MSGIKKATVSRNLSKVMQVVNEGLTQFASMASSTENVGLEEFIQEQRTAQRVHDNMDRVLPEDLAAFVQGETALWESLIKRHDQKYEQAGRAAAEADGLNANIQNKFSQGKSDLNAIANKANQIRNQIAGRSYYLDAENAQAKHLCEAARRVLAEVETNLPLAQRAQQSRRNAYVAYSESASLAQAAQREYDRLLNLARNRQENQRIAEENERKATNLAIDLDTLHLQVQSKDYNKFGQGLYSDTVRRELFSIRDLMVGGAYEDAIVRATKMKETLENILSTINAAEQKWQAEKTAAEKALRDALDELKIVHREDLELYSGLKKEDIAALYASISKASRDMASENFEVASKRIETTMSQIRHANEAAVQNKRLSDERNEMAQCIMQALYDCEYDTPEYYLKDESDELSDLCIVAAAPGQVGDMKMRVSLAGKVDFEVANIPEGREQLCIDAVLKMQEKLAEDDVNFNVTNWGRAENQNKVHLDVRPKEQQVQKTIQRQG